MLKYFGTDGVRGVANAGLTPEMAFKLGRDGGYVLTKYVHKVQMLVFKFQLHIIQLKIMELNSSAVMA